MSIASDMIRGHTETIILKQLLTQDSYGYQINKAIQEATGGFYELKEATLYTAFRRLEQAGLILSYWGDENTGARRRYYSITNEGRAQYQQSVKDWREAKELIDKLILQGGAEHDRQNSGVYRPCVCGCSGDTEGAGIQGGTVLKLD